MFGGRVKKIANTGGLEPPTHGLKILVVLWLFVQTAQITLLYQLSYVFGKNKKEDREGVAPSTFGTHF